MIFRVHLERLPPALRAPYIDRILDGLGDEEPVLDYVRLNWDAVAR